MEAIADSEQNPCRRTSRGRQKIEIKKVEKENSRYVTFSKRKNGIFKKAAEISTLCGADIVVVLFSEHGKVFSYGEPEVDKLIDRYLATELEVEKNKNSSNYDQSESNILQIKAAQEQEYLNAVAVVEKLKRGLKMAEKNRNSMNSNGEEFWWEVPIEESTEEEEIEGYKESLEELKKNVVNRIEAISACNSASDESRIINQFINNQGWSNNYNYSLYGSGLTNSHEFFSSFSNGGSF